MTSNRPKPYRESRPWGDFVEFTKEQPSTVKIVHVKAREATSLQSHKKRDEFWRIIQGSGFATVGDARSEARIGHEFFIPKGVKHRLEANDSGISALEISFGIFDEADITRFEDRYGRAGPN